MEILENDKAPASDPISIIHYLYTFVLKNETIKTSADVFMLNLWRPQLNGLVIAGEGDVTAEMRRIRRLLETRWRKWRDREMGRSRSRERGGESEETERVRGRRLKWRDRESARSRSRVKGKGGGTREKEGEVDSYEETGWETSRGREGEGEVRERGQFCGSPNLGEDSK